MNKDPREKFKQARELLDKEYDWPSLYTFKFIVPRDKESEVTSLFPDHVPEMRLSKKGKYISITINYMAPSSDHVLAIYEKASQIPGIISL